ncbi:MAG TPA: hypothetical protein VFA20_03260 [Myxococcaceae bacterium]|nr:hypothetical protein [Myxococcaceae bacterium]
MDHPKPTTRTPTMPPVLARRMARALSALADDLVNPYDESTDEFTPFSARLDPAKPFDDAALRAALHVADRYRLDKRDMDPHAFDEWGEPYCSSYATLCKVMNATLTDIQVVWARAPGVVRVRTWFVGRMGTEWLVGLRTQSTET